MIKSESFDTLLLKCQKRHRYSYKKAKKVINVLKKKECFACENALFCQKERYWNEIFYSLIYEHRNYLIPISIRLEEVEIYLSDQYFTKF